MTHDPREALEPCPFCGGNAQIIEGEESAYVQCLDVKMHRALWVTGDNNTANEVAEQWNTRALTAFAPGEQQPVAWPSDGSCVRCGAVPRTSSGLCNTCLDEDAERSENSPPPAAGCPDWGQIVQSLLRSMDHPFKGESSSEQAERMADDLCKKYPALRREAPAPEGVASIVTCCVTGAIPGDGGACGDCDPCIMGEASVPEAVKRLIAEKNSLIQRIGELEDASRLDAGGGVRVKPLHWNRSKVFGFYKWRGSGVFGEFSAFGEGDMTPEQIESAKARIQSDYERRILSALSTPSDAVNESAPQPGNSYYTIQSALSPHMASSTELMAAMSSIWPLIKSPSVVNESAEARLREALAETSGSTRWAVDRAKDMLSAGINIQAIGGVTNSVVTGVIKSLLDHIDELDADLKAAIAVGRMAALSAGGDGAKKSIPMQDAESVSGAHVADRTGDANPPTGANSSDPPDRREIVARALHAAHTPFCDYTYPYEHEMSSRHVYEALADAAIAALDGDKR